MRTASRAPVLAAAAIVVAALAALAVWVAPVKLFEPVPASTAAPSGSVVALPSPAVRGDVSLEEALAARRSVRELSGPALTRAEVGQLLWAAQGVTDAEGRRTAPSAGALYPLELYALTADGLFHYLPDGHALERLQTNDLRAALREAALGQPAVGDAPLVVAITAVPSRTEARYGPSRTPRYVALEAGHAAQGLLLEAVALGLAGVPIGAFDDGSIGDVLGLADGEEPLYLLAIGHRR